MIGRRERKKAQTRKALADAAHVSVTTLFKYFPSKEALVFDQDEDIEAALVGAVQGRPPGYTVVDALREHLLRLVESAPSDEFLSLIESEPA